jgi:hypothetical protein
MPWCLAFARRITNGAAASGFVWLSVALAMAFLAAAPEPVIFIVLLLAALAVWHGLGVWRARGFSAAWRPAAVILAAVAAAFLLSGVELVPFLYTLHYSARQETLLQSDASMWSARPSDALFTLLPRFYLFPDRGGIYWESQHWLKTVYLGALIPFLAAWTLLFVHRKPSLARNVIAVILGAAAALGLAFWTRHYYTPQALADHPFPLTYKLITAAAGGLVGFAIAATRRRNVFFAVVSIPFLLLALGPNSGFWQFFYDHVPGVGLIRFPVKFYLPAALAISVLAGFAVDDFLLFARKKPRVNPSILVISLSVAAVLFAIAWAAMSLEPEAVFKWITPSALIGLGDTGAEQAVDCFQSTEWSFARSAAVLAAGAAALFAAAFITRRRIPRPYGAVAIALALFVDAGLFGAHLNPVANAGLFTERPSHLAMAPHGQSDSRLFMTGALSANIRKTRLARIEDVTGLRNYLSLVKGTNAQDDSTLMAWVSHTTAPSFSNVGDLDAWLKSVNSSQFVAEVEFEMVKETFYPNLNLLYHVPTVDVFEPMMVKWHHDLLARVLGNRTSPETAALLARMWGAGTLVDASDLPPGFVFLQAETPGTRGVLADHVISVETDAEAQSTVADSGINVLERIVLFRSDADVAREFLGPSAFDPPDASSPAPGAARVTFDNGNRSTFEVTAARRALLFVADNYFPNFTAFVDGRPTPLWRANYGYRAVPVDSGEHTVEFVWRPYDFYAGLAATLAGIALLIAAPWVSRRRRNTDTQKNPTEG